MGNQCSTAACKNGQQREPFCNSATETFFVNIRSPNLLQFIHIDEKLFQAILPLLDTCAKTVKRLKIVNGYEVDLSENQFENQSKNAVCNFDFDHTFSRILALLNDRGWIPNATMNLSLLLDRSTVFFSKSGHWSLFKDMENECPFVSTVIAITFSGAFSVDITANDEKFLDYAGQTVYAALKDVCETACFIWQMSASGDRCTVTVPFNLRESSSVPDSVQSRRLALKLAARFEMDHFQLMTCIDFRGQADTMFFVKSSSMTPLPIAERPAYCTFINSYFLLSFNQWNLLRLHDANQDVVAATRLQLTQYWAEGIREEASDDTYHEFLLGAYPWAAKDGDAVESMGFVCSLLQTYLARGWRPLPSFHLGRNFKDRTCIIFKKERPAYRPHFCLGLLNTNEVGLVHAEDDLRDLLVQGMARNRIATGKITVKAEWPCIVLKGNPWCCNERTKFRKARCIKKSRFCPEDDQGYLLARVHVQCMLNILDNRAWTPVISLDLAARMKCKNGFHSITGKGQDAHDGEYEYSIPLDVNSLILANANGSRHSSIAAPVQTGFYPSGSHKLSYA